MNLLINIEIIIRLVLTILLIVTPLGWLASKYFPEVKKLLKTLQELELPQEIKDDLSPTHEVSLGKADLLPKKDVEQILASENPKQEKQTIVEEIATVEKNTNNNTEEKNTPEESVDHIKRNKKLETIKYTAIASKERGRNDQYEKKLVEGLALDPENKDFLVMLGSHYFEAKQEIKALTLLKKVINKDPKNHKAIRQIGQIYNMQGQRETAQLLIEKAVSLKNDHPKYYISLVEIRYETGNIEKAIQTMEKLLKIRPTNTDYLLTMATLYEEDKKPTLASKYFSKVLELDPSHTEAKKGRKRVK